MSEPETTPPYGPPAHEETHARPTHVAITVVLGAVAVLATLVVGGLITLGDAAAGRAAERGECLPGGDGPCLTRVVATLTEGGGRRGNITWSTDDGLEFSTSRTEKVAAGIDDGIQVDLLVYRDNVVSVLGPDERLDLSESGYLGATLDGLVTAAVLVLVGGMLLVFLVPRVSTDRVAYVVVGGWGGLVAGAASAFFGQPLTTTVAVAAVGLVVGIGLGSVVRVARPRRWIA